MALRDNPILIQQRARFRRLRWFWPLLILLWAALSWLLRDYVFLMATNRAVGAGGLAMEIALGLPWILRADVIIAPLLVLTLAPLHQWQRRRPELVLTPLSPRALLRGLMALPLTVLVVLNTLSAPLFYEHLITERLNAGMNTWQSALEGGLSALLAWVEDLLFATLVILIVVSGAFRPGVTLPRLLTGALFRSVLLAVAIGVVSLLAGLLLDLINSQTLFFFRPFGSVAQLFGMAAIFAFEGLTIAILWRRTERMMGRWLLPGGQAGEDSV